MTDQYLFPELSDSLLSHWMTGNKDIKLNFMSSLLILMSAEATTILWKAAIHPICFLPQFLSVFSLNLTSGVRKLTVFLQKIDSFLGMNRDLIILILKI